MINKEKALQKLGEISVIDWEIQKQQKKIPKVKFLFFKLHNKGF